ncbi:hypothetical protein SY88_05670 [Clostridiales bacterium PH28_bin88]|nr:hypothetical protein SY88_05670 [Clostridiales bacterium PH28_bin88]
MNRLELTFEIVTPLFVAGADQNAAELRAASIKGALRFWYRAIDGNYAQREGLIFGGHKKGEGQSAFLLKVDRLESAHGDLWSKNKYDEAFGEGRGRHKRNGVTYFGFPLETGNRERGNYRQRAYIKAGQDFKVQMVFKEAPRREFDRKAVLAAFWFLGHFGGIGFRARRGFGSIALKEWRTVQGEPWPEMGELAPAHGAGTPEEWAAALETGIKRIRNWFPASPAATHTVVDRDSRFLLINEGNSGGPKGNEFFPAWVHALDRGGRLMQDFRKRKHPDYVVVKRHLCFADRKVASAHPEVQPWKMATAPERVRFGLPLAFRYGSLQYPIRGGGWKTPAIVLQGVDHSRSASPVWVRVIRIGPKCYPFFAFLSAPLLPPGEQLGDGNPLRHRFLQPSPQILQEFQHFLMENTSYLEVRV